MAKQPDDGIKLPTTYTVVMHHKVEIPDNQLQLMYTTATTCTWVIAIALVISAIFRRNNAKGT